ncbi:response regulator [Paenibacillus glycinis]|uniref:Uncharacterized protein n=1 Tax=Paenibacillus glycinis TaxID=2697035 RepID=A0ABW9XZ54_9BACL|nr:hypothetical protein [Paenibacillus glycinis]NBD28003.1 hypothetical protein [Paenibacillus glycinis]
MKYPQSYTDFMSSALTEEEYVKRTSWQEIKELRGNPLLFSLYLLKFRNPGNRRMALFKASGMKREDLEKLLMSGSSLVTALKRESNRQIRPGVISKFCILFRITFSWGARAYPAEDFNFHTFDYVEDGLITKEDKLISLLSPVMDINWSVNGYQLKLDGAETIYLRIEQRPGLVILDLMNPRIDLLELLISILQTVSGKWRFQQMPSLVVGHSFYVFFGSNEESLIEKVVIEEYPLIKKLYELPAVYGGK